MKNRNKLMTIMSFVILFSFFVLTANCAVENTRTESTNNSGGSGATISLTTETVALQVGGLTINMRYVPGKIFRTGILDLGISSVIDPYLIAETEVTYELWNAVRVWATTGSGSMGAGLYTFDNVGRQGGDINVCCVAVGTNKHPVTTISWRDALVWTNALTEYYNATNGATIAVVYTMDAGYTIPIRSSVDLAYTSSTNMTPGSFDNPYVNPLAKGFRLPTDAEWELAARYIGDFNNDGDIMNINEYYHGIAASGAVLPFTDFTSTSLVAWFGSSFISGIGNTTTTQAVATKNPNALGIFDMSGNVWEWDFAWYPGFVGTGRLGRGGGWYDAADGMQIGSVKISSPYVKFSGMGFRTARNP